MDMYEQIICRWRADYELGRTQERNTWERNADHSQQKEQPPVAETLEAEE